MHRELEHDSQHRVTRDLGDIAQGDRVEVDIVVTTAAGGTITNSVSVAAITS